MSRPPSSRPPSNAFSSDRLPPNQLATSRFPRIGEREPEPFDAAEWTLAVDGLVARPLTLDWAAFAALPREERVGTIHCVTRWSRPNTRFRGVSLATLLEDAGQLPEAHFVRFVSGRGHDTSLPLALACTDVLIADAMDVGDGLVPLPPEHGGPVRTILFSRYLYKSVKWVRRIELLREDCLGSWERGAGYHNGGDPWREERYVVRDVDAHVLRRLLAARDLSGRDLLGADLRGADLTGFRMDGAALRNVDLRDARLVGADLRAANLSNADLRGAELTHALLDGADLDGVDLRGADLRGARGSPGSLAAAQFTDGVKAALVEGLDWSQTPLDGALEAQVAFLREAGVRLPADG